MRRDGRPPENSGEASGAGPRSYVEGKWELVRGRCEDVLPALPPKAFHACVTDPPYGLGLADWDREAPSAETWEKVLAVIVVPQRRPSPVARARHGAFDCGR